METLGTGDSCASPTPIVKATGQHETASRRFADKPIFCRAVAALGAVAVSCCAYPPSASQYESFTERAAAEPAEVHDSSCARWRRARDAMVNMFLVRGDINGARHADDWMLQQAHAGTNGHLMDAIQYMDAGNPQVAAQHLAAAHAFLPDDVMGQFGIDASREYLGSAARRAGSVTDGGRRFANHAQSNCLALEPDDRPASLCGDRNGAAPALEWSQRTGRSCRASCIYSSEPAVTGRAAMLTA